MNCPVNHCDFIFVSSHYTDREPHLREKHNLIQLSRVIQILLRKIEWSKAMAEETIEKMETLL